MRTEHRRNFPSYNHRPVSSPGERVAWDEGLAGKARDIAATDKSPLRVMAGPGTGKSFAMKRRVARLIETGADPRRILAVTFTRNAAASLLHDLHKLNLPDCDKIRAGTLHSFCFSVLLRKQVFEYLNRIPRPLVTFTKSAIYRFECTPLLQDISLEGDFGVSRACTKRIRAFEAAWARLQSEEPGWPQDPLDQQFQTALVGWLRFHHAMLIGELVPETLRFLRNNPNTDMLRAYDHIIVDEYQDLNRAEQELVQLLSAHGKIAIVGDIDQSIYSFRHANPEGIETYGQRHQDTHDETLDECRRCPTRVVEIADHLIRHNHVGINQPRLRPLPESKRGEVHLVQWANVDDEVVGLSDFVQNLVTARNYKPGNILILTPRRRLGYAIRDRLSTLKIPAHSFYHEEALEGEGAQRAFAALSLFCDAEDRVALRWWLGDGSASTRRNAYQRLRQHCEQTGVSPRTALEKLAADELKLPNVGELIARFKQLGTTLQNLEGRSVPELVDQLLPAEDDGCAILREASLLALAALNTPQELLDYWRTHVTQPEMPEEGDFVRVMSLHKSKGLTSKVAVIVGCSQSLIPYEDFNKPAVEQAAQLKEQRRLFYVAITRCTEILVISSAAQMNRMFAWSIGARLVKGQGVNGPTIASQFIAELGPGAPPSQTGVAWGAGGYPAL